MRRRGGGTSVLTRPRTRRRSSPVACQGVLTARACGPPSQRHPLHCGQRCADQGFGIARRSDESFVVPGPPSRSRSRLGRRLRWDAPQPTAGLSQGSRARKRRPRDRGRVGACLLAPRDQQPAPGRPGHCTPTNAGPVGADHLPLRRRPVRQWELADRRLGDVEQVERGLDDGELALGVAGGTEGPAERVSCDQGASHRHLARHVGEGPDVDADGRDACRFDRSLYVSN